MFCTIYASAIERTILSESRMKEEDVLKVLEEEGIDDFDKAERIV